MNNSPKIVWWRPSEWDLSPWNGAPNTPPRARDRAPPQKSLVQYFWTQTACPPRLQGSWPRRWPPAACAARLTHVELRILTPILLTGPLPSDKVIGRGKTMQTSYAGGVKAGKTKQASTRLLPLLSRRRDHTPCWCRSLGRTLPPISFAVEVHSGSGSRSRLKQRPPNSTHLQGRPRGRAYLGGSEVVPRKQAPPEL